MLIKNDLELLNKLSITQLYEIVDFFLNIYLIKLLIFAFDSDQLNKCLFMISKIKTKST